MFLNFNWNYPIIRKCRIKLIKHKKIKVKACCSIIIPPGSGGIISKKLEVYFSKIIALTPSKINDL